MAGNDGINLVNVGKNQEDNILNIQAAEISKPVQASKIKIWRPWEASSNGKGFSADYHFLKDYISNGHFCIEKEPEKRLDNTQLSKYINHSDTIFDRIAALINLLSITNTC